MDRIEMENVAVWVAGQMDLDDLREYAIPILVRDYEAFPDLFQEDLELFQESLREFEE